MKSHKFAFLTSKLKGFLFLLYAFVSGRCHTVCLLGAQVLHPAGFTGTVTVSLPAFPALQPLTYSVVSRDLVVQSLGFSICPLTFGAL